MEHQIGKLSELAEGQPISVSIAGTDLVVIREGSEVFIFEDRCSHADVALSGGTCADGQIECPAHGARFDLRTGAAKCMPAVRPIKKFQARIVEELVFVDFE